MLAAPRRSDEVAEFLQSAVRTGLPTQILGRGSNTLIVDGVIDHPVILMNRFSKVISLSPETGRVYADAGASLPEIARRAADAGIGGLEYLAVIPGLLGGGVVMNCGIGGPGGPDIARNLVNVDTLDFSGRQVRAEVSVLHISYRSIRLPQSGLVTAAVLQGEPGHDPAKLLVAIEGLKQRRRARQPRTRRTSGSIWLPEGSIPAGEIIDDCGLRGFSAGRAGISTDHANWILTRPGCTAGEVASLIRTVEDSVYSLTGIRLQRELCTLPQQVSKSI